MHYKDELDNYKKKLSQLSKLEVTLDFYKQKYEDCGMLTEKCTELESQNENIQNRMQETEKEIESLRTKSKKYMDQYTAEKDRNINLELTITKKDAELESLRNERKRLETNLNELEVKLHEQHKQLEVFKHESEDSARKNHQSTERAMKQIANQSYDESIPNDSFMKKSRNTNVTPEDEVDIEMLKKEIELLRQKCHDLQKENETLKLNKESNQNDVQKQYEKATKENESLKDDINRLRSNDTTNKEMSNAERKKLLDEINSLRERLEFAVKSAAANNSKSPDDVSEKMRHLQEVLDTAKEENEGQRKIISELSVQLANAKNELDSYRGIFNELDDQKEEEIRVLASAFHELAMRNFDLEKKLAGQSSSDQKAKMASTFSTSSAQKPRK